MSDGRFQVDDIWNQVPLLRSAKDRSHWLPPLSESVRMPERVSGANDSMATQYVLVTMIFCGLKSTVISAIFENPESG